MSRAPDVAREASDADLVRSAAAGDVPAFHQLVDRHAKRLFRMARALTPSRSDAEDVVQETLIGAFRSLKSFNQRSTVKTWLASILIRQAAKGWHRSRNSRRTRSYHCDREDGDADEPGLVVASKTERLDQQMDFAAMVKQLPPYYREVLVLREVQQLTYDEIAQAMSMPRGTVESRVHRARLQLRQLLGAYAPRVSEQASVK